MNRIKHHTLKVIKHPLFSGSVIMFVGNMGANGINYVYHLVMGRMLGPVNYGVLASLYSIMYLVSIIPSSASVSIVKFVSSAKNSELYSVYTSIKKLIFKLAIVLAVLMFVMSPSISRFLHIENVSSVALIAPVLFFSLVTLVNQSTSQGFLKFLGFVIPALISSLAKLLIGVGLILLGWSVFGVMLAIVIGAILAYFYSQKFIKKHIKPGKTKDVDLKPFLKYSGPVLLQSLAFTSIFTIDVVLVKHFLDPFSAGIYAAISTLGKIIFFATSPVTSTMFPVVSKRRASNQSYSKIFLASLLITASIALVITAFYWLFPELAIGVLYGKDYLSAKTDLVWMGAFMLFYTLSNLLVNFFLSIGKVRIVFVPLLAALAQVGLIWLYHGSITQVIQISLCVTFAMFICLATYTGYNLVYETKNNE
ncbi:oligosaccharide flippase family protein [Candidatus Microgenomates bacterium]|nr:oligosaccharide flippase family protein [Candidatus Microgenomates bacterium]